MNVRLPVGTDQRYSVPAVGTQRTNAFRPYWLLLLLLCTVLAGTTGRAQAQATVPFSCDGAFYQLRANAAATGSDFYRIRRGTTFVNTLLYSVPVVLNCLAFSKADGYYYAVQRVADGTAPHIYKLGQNSYTDLGTVPGLPGNYYSSATIDENGIYWLQRNNYNGNGSTNGLLQKVQVTASGLTYANSLQVRQGGANFGPIATGDLAFNPKNGLLYNVGTEDLYYTIDRTTGVAVTYGAYVSTAGVGSAFFDALGNLFYYTNGTPGNTNSGGFYFIPQQAPSTTTVSSYRVLINNAPPTGESDGASCAFPDQRLDVVQELASVTPVSAGVFDISYTVRINNPGSVDAPNVQLTEFGGPGTGTSFPGATSVTRAPSTSVVVSGGLPGTAANTSFTGTGTFTDLLNGDATLGFGQTATVTYTLRVTYPTASVPASANNTIYVSSTSNSPNPGHTNTNGTILPPPDLLAADASTNGAIFPVNSNADTSSPTPVPFIRAIYGTVFEDVNYGGGAGRSQGASQGVGRGGVRVELYTVTAGVATFTSFTTTSSTAGSVGEYSFTSGLASGGSYIVRVVNSSVTSSRAGSTTALRGVQTYVYNNSSRVGGEDPSRGDAGDGSAGLSALNVLTVGNTVGTIAQSQAPVVLSSIAASPAVNVDFGFNFDLVVNTNNAGQGSLRQFIINSNLLTGEAALSQVYTNAAGATTALPTARETSIFMLPKGQLVPGQAAGLTSAFVGNTATITLTAALDNVAGASTGIDGSTQTRSTGDTNPASTTAGAQTTGPEVIIDFNQFGGLYATGASTRIASIGLNNAKGATNSTSAGITIFGAPAAGSVVTDVTTFGNARAGVRLESNATNGIGLANVTVSNNVLSNNSANTADADGLELLGTSGATITGNVINGNKGYGIFMTSNTNTGNNISNNTISGNGTGTTSANAGINITQGTNNLFSNNTISGNAGDGIVAFGNTSGNRFMQNSISGNGGTSMGALGIDLAAAGVTAVTGDDVSRNADGKTAASGANGLLNFPVFTQATINNGNLYVTGYVKAGALVELFVASADPTNFGEGITYVASRTEGTGEDSDARYANYNGTTGVGATSNPNSGTETAVSRFQFTVPVNSTQIANLVAGKITATATVLGTALVNGIAVGNTSEFSAVFAVANNTPLPVELTDFTAVAVKNVDAALVWHTASEKSNDHFEVERSLTGTDFVKIGQVKGQGTSTVPTAYALTDAGIGPQAQGLVYYRLKQVDTDGTFSYSPVRTVAFTAAAPTISLYPNPATSATQLDLRLLSGGTYEVRVLDAAGRVVLRASHVGGLSQGLDLTQLASGTYLVQVQGQALNLTKRLIKK